MKTMLITIQSIVGGFFNVKIKPVVGSTFYREFTPEAFHEYVMDLDFHCEVKGYQYKIIIPDNIKKLCAQWLQSQASSEASE
jgi:hypothetical protein